MRSVLCHGSPYEIGLQHGEQARNEVLGSIEFYKALFKKECSMDWPEVCHTAGKFTQFLETSFPEYLEEIEGIAQGAGLETDAILALNVRTELAYGMFSDGCTAFSWKCDEDSFLAQNWDWDEAQGPNLISMQICPSDSSKPSIHMITEAGIIGKIGLNSYGVGVTLNAIKSAGVNFSKIPCHLALRTVLNSVSMAEAVAKLEEIGVASSCHLLIADPTGAVGLECSVFSVVRLNMGDEGEPCPGVITHTNHFVRPHDNARSEMFLSDSVPRLNRVRELVGKVSRFSPDFCTIARILKDEDGYPTAICRAPTENDSYTSLFGIIMDLKEKSAVLSVGRPANSTKTMQLYPDCR